MGTENAYVPLWKKPKLLSSVTIDSITGSGVSALYLRMPVSRDKWC